MKCCNGRHYLMRLSSANTLTHASQNNTAFDMPLCSDGRPDSVLCKCRWCLFVTQ